MHNGQKSESLPLGSFQLTSVTVAVALRLVHVRVVEPPVRAALTDPCTTEIFGVKDFFVGISPLSPPIFFAWKFAGVYYPYNPISLLTTNITTIG